MKILVAQFVSESNEFIPHFTELEDYDLRFGQECMIAMKLEKASQNQEITVIPSIYANAASGGIVEKHAFDYIENRILADIKKNLKDLDAIFFSLHGASEVQDLEGGSGDHHILKEVRKIVGPYFPIAVVCDPHGNLSKEYVERATILRSYRESPHTDIAQSVELVWQMLINLLHERQNIVPEYRKLPLILGGEQSVSSDEPVKSINKYLDELEKDERILSCSWHVGYIRHDCDVAGCGVVVVPKTENDQKHASKIADQLANYVWEKRHEFHYTGLTAHPVEALQMALDFKEKPVILTDSGDNVTSGAMGANTLMLQQILDLSDYHGKKILVAGIRDEKTVQSLLEWEHPEEVNLEVGMNTNELTKKVVFNAKIKNIGKMKGCISYGYTGDDYGNIITLSLLDKPVDVILSDTGNHPFVEEHQYVAAGVDWNDYDIIIVKLGYAFPELKAKAKLCVMSLTRGSTYQDTAALPFKRIMRPMYPIDQI